MKCTYLLASVALASVTSAQVSVDWVATHALGPGVGNEVNAVAVDATGRVAVGGTTRALGPSGVFGGDIETCMYGSDGTLAWSRSVDVNDSDRCWAVAFDGTGGLFVAGLGSQQSPPYGYDRVLLRYDAAGNLLWSNTLAGTSLMAGIGLALCPNGDVIVAGSHNKDLSLERVDPAGNVLWTWTRDFGGHDLLNAVAVGPGGDVWATGFVSGYPIDATVVVRVTSAGVLQWVRTLDEHSNNDTFRALVVDAAGNASVAASIEGDAAIARWTPTGQLAWVRRYGNTNNPYEYASHIALDPFGRIVAAGRLCDSVTEWDFAVWCLDTDGNSIWERTWNGRFGEYDLLRGLVVDEMGAVWLSGASPASTVGFGKDLTIASWDSTGAFRWSWRYPGAGLGTTQFAGVAAVNGNNVIVTGSVPAAPNDTLILKLNRTAVEYCFGDGSSTPCPCANASAPAQHSGCANALGLGARLVDEGASSLAADTLVLAGSQMPDGDALYFQGTSSMSAGAGEPFGDGLSCVGGTLIRLGSSTNVAGASQFPDVGDPSVSLRGLVTTPGSRRTYQVWYRDASAFCTTANFNFSNGLSITWTL